MTERDADQMERSFDPFIPTGVMLPTLQMWQLPVMIGTAWWNAIIDMMWPQHAARPGRPGDTHAQLVVPEPIESTGEHSLLA